MKVLNEANPSLGYRTNKLTYLLEEVLKNGKILLLVHINPKLDFAEESKSTLVFANTCQGGHMETKNLGAIRFGPNLLLWRVYMVFIIFHDRFFPIIPLEPVRSVLIILATTSQPLHHARLSFAKRQQVSIWLAPYSWRWQPSLNALLVIQSPCLRREGH